MTGIARFPRLLADIGGTHARFGWREHVGSPITDVASLPTRDHARLQDAVRHYLREHRKAAPCAAAIVIATPVTGDLVVMTNHSWQFSIAALQAELGLQQLRVINDFTALALALALPVLDPSELVQVGGGTRIAAAPMALLGPGTGLGVSGLLRAGDVWVPLAGEGGHVTLAASNQREAHVLGLLRQRFGHASGERAVSGQGLLALYDAVCQLNGTAAPEAMTPAAVMQSALAGNDAPQHAECAETLHLFCAFLGTLAADLALTLGARGGVYIGGGIVPRMGGTLAHSPFRQRFEDKGRFSGYLAGVATFVIDAAAAPALRGADQALG